MINFSISRNLIFGAKPIAGGLFLTGGGDETVGDDMFRAMRGRFSWLLVNLLTAILASIVIGFFDGTIEQMVALAILMPIVASMGGNAERGASNPDKKRKGINNNLSRALAFSLQKQREAIRLCSRKAIEKAIHVANQASKK